MGIARPKSSPGDIVGVFFALALFAAAFATPGESAASPPAVPVIDIVMASRSTLFGGQSTQVFCVAHDESVSELEYYWTCLGGTLVPSGDSAVWFAPEIPGTYPVAVQVYDGIGGFAGDGVSITVVQNDPPALASVTAQPDRLLPGESTVLTCEASDPEGQAIVYDWLAPTGEIAGSGSSVTWTAPARPGDHIVILTATDELGATSTYDVVIHVQCPEPPAIDQLIVWPTMPDYTKVDNRGAYRLLRGSLTQCEIECVTTPSDANLTYEWSCTKGSIDGTGNIVLFIPPQESTEVYVTATVRDVCGQSTEAQVLFRVYLGDKYPTDIPTAPGCLRCARGY